MCINETTVTTIVLQTHHEQQCENQHHRTKKQSRNIRTIYVRTIQDDCWNALLGNVVQLLPRRYETHHDYTVEIVVTQIES